MGKRFNIREHPDMERDINRRTAIKKELAEIDARLMEKRAALVHEIRPDLFMR